MTRELMEVFINEMAKERKKKVLNPWKPGMDLKPYIKKNKYDMIDVITELYNYEEMLESMYNWYKERPKYKKHKEIKKVMNKLNGMIDELAETVASGVID